MIYEARKTAPLTAEDRLIAARQFHLHAIRDAIDADIMARLLRFRQDIGARAFPERLGS